MTFPHLRLTQISALIADLGEILVELDSGKDGADDFAGWLCIWLNDVMRAYDQGEDDLPPIPDILLGGTATKITGVPRTMLKQAKKAMWVFKLFVHGRAGKALDFIDDAIDALLDAKPVAAPPADIAKMVLSTTDLSVQPAVV
jgi:hypothetical protein